MKTLAEKQHFVGCDVSKSTLDLAIHQLQTDTRLFKHLKVSNDAAGFKEALKWFKKNKLKKTDIVVAMDHTGIYSLAFGEYLAKNHVDFCMLHPIAVKRSCPQGRQKTDKDDAQYIADYVYTQREKLQPSSPEDPQIKKQRSLDAERKLMVRNRTALLNHIKTQSDTQIVNRLKKMIDEHSSHIRSIEKQILKTIEESRAIKENYELLISIPGIGMINAINAIISTGNFTRFKTARQYAKFCGVSPISNQSGTSVHGGDHVIKACHGELKALLTQGVRTAIKDDPEINAYYEKNLATGAVRCIDDEIPFDIPKGWEWCRLDDVCQYIQRGKSPKYSLIREIPVVAQKCNQWTGFSIEKAQFIDPATLSSYGQERFLQDGDLMWNSTGLGTLGRMAIYWERLNPYNIAVADSHVTVIRTFKDWVQSQFLYYYFSSNTVQSVIEDKAEGSTKQKELYTKTVKEYLVPIPPLSEQIRIIQRIELLTPFVDSYTKIHEHYVELNESVKIKLKSSILQEAIQGKLVPQIEEEGTAEELLAEIRAEKQRLVKEGKLKKSAIANESRIFRGDDNKYYENTSNGMICIDDEIPFEIPKSWMWVRLDNICEYIQRGRSPKYSPIKKIPVVAQKCNQWTGFQIDKAQFVDPDTLPSYGKGRFLQDGDLMWNSTGLGTLGRMAIYRNHLNPYGIAVADSHVTVIRPFKEYIASLYLFVYFTSKTVQSVIEEKSDGSTKQKELATTTVKNYIVPLPPLSEQKRIVQMIAHLNPILSK